MRRTTIIALASFLLGSIVMNVSLTTTPTAWWLCVKPGFSTRLSNRFNLTITHDSSTSSGAIMYYNNTNRSLVPAAIAWSPDDGLWFQKPGG